MEGHGAGEHADGERALALAPTDEAHRDCSSEEKITPLHLRSVPRAKQEEADQLTPTGGQLRERLRGPCEGNTRSRIWEETTQH